MCRKGILFSAKAGCKLLRGRGGRERESLCKLFYDETWGRGLTVSSWIMDYIYKSGKLFSLVRDSLSLIFFFLYQTRVYTVNTCKHILASLNLPSAKSGPREAGKILPHLPLLTVPPKLMFCFYTFILFIQRTIQPASARLHQITDAHKKWNCFTPQLCLV